ncbi:MAG: type II toxin-antitoxin system RelE/ParE family toxin [Bacteroidia bacterium]
MAKYFLTNKASDDLSEIWNYTYEAWSENQADKYYELLIAAFKEIAKNPDIGKHYEEISTELLGIRVGKHIVFYRQANFREIEILRILHERMDLKSRMQE